MLHLVFKVSSTCSHTRLKSLSPLSNCFINSAGQAGRICSGIPIPLWKKISRRTQKFRRDSPRNMPIKITGRMKPQINLSKG